MFLWRKEADIIRPLGHRNESEDTQDKEQYAYYNPIPAEHGEAVLLDIGHELLDNDP